MANEKKYTHLPVVYRTKCIKWNDTVFLKPKWYDVLGKLDNNLLIRFNSGGANWYEQSRFVGQWSQDKIKII